jgi:Protein of unknown function (DUF3050)
LEVNTLDDLKVFMAYHIFPVWDFMSLLKALQNNLTCTKTPWFPVGDAETRYLINEIVIGEESDVDEKGLRKSHFELYLEAMNEAGANITQIEQFVSILKETTDFNLAFHAAKVPLEVQEFVNFTFKTIHTSKDYLQAAVFTFGREDLIPDMFYSIVKEINNQLPKETKIFKYYLERHIEVDGGHHRELALKMVSNLCGTNENYWNQAQEFVIESLKMRIKLWDGVYNQLLKQKEVISL